MQSDGIQNLIVSMVQSHHHLQTQRRHQTFPFRSVACKIIK
jgi:hypothetical protein